jgi:hypothetical protein
MAPGAAGDFCALVCETRMGVNAQVCGGFSRWVEIRSGCGVRRCIFRVMREGAELLARSQIDNGVGGIEFGVRNSECGVRSARRGEFKVSGSRKGSGACLSEWGFRHPPWWKSFGRAAVAGFDHMYIIT